MFVKSASQTRQQHQWLALMPLYHERLFLPWSGQNNGLSDLF